MLEFKKEKLELKNDTQKEKTFNFTPKESTQSSSVVVVDDDDEPTVKPKPINNKITKIIHQERDKLPVFENRYQPENRFLSKKRPILEKRPSDVNRPVNAVKAVNSDYLSISRKVNYENFRQSYSDLFEKLIPAEFKKGQVENLKKNPSTSEAYEKIQSNYIILNLHLLY